jgi:hypothetical protein
VGIALLIMLDRLEPAGRLSFALHDMFAVPFDEIAAILGRSPDATRQLASRAPVVSRANLIEQRDVVHAVLTASRAGGFEALVAGLDPEVVVRIDEAAACSGRRWEIRAARIWKDAIAFSPHVRVDMQVILVDGQVGLV